jgi:hypothetical protein
MGTRIGTIVVVAAVLASLGSGSAMAGTGAKPAAPAWGAAIQVPGTAALNADGHAETDSVSCASAGNCSAGGEYTDGSDAEQAFVASQVSGTWGAAIEVPGIAALNKGMLSQVESVSCAAAGNCSAGGYYYDSFGASQAFVASQVNGTWGSAIELPGTATLNAGGNAQVNSVSCPSAGNCTAGGTYASSSGKTQAFVVREVNGTWRAATEVRGTAALNAGGAAAIDSVSCASAANCTAGGMYTNSLGRLQAFVVSLVSGSWHAATEVPGTALLNLGGAAAISSVSCASAGNCGAGGYYTDLLGRMQAFVASQVAGTWGSAVEVPGTAALNAGGAAQVDSVSCVTAGSCAAGGEYADSSTRGQAFVVRQVSGTWGSAVEVPGTAALNAGGSAYVASVSCTAAGSCSAGGTYAVSNGDFQAFVVSLVSGTWGSAAEVPGSAALNAGRDAQVNSVSCASASSCSAGGSYTDSSRHGQAFVVSKT